MSGLAANINQKHWQGNSAPRQANLSRHRSLQNSLLDLFTSGIQKLLIRLRCAQPNQTWTLETMKLSQFMWKARNAEQSVTFVQPWLIHHWLASVASLLTEQFCLISRPSIRHRSLSMPSPNSDHAKQGHEPNCSNICKSAAVHIVLPFHFDWPVRVLLVHEHVINRLRHTPLAGTCDVLEEA